MLQHNDLGAEHVIVDDGAISGIIDWSDAAITDPASELGRLLRDLGEAALPHVLDGYGAAGAERAALTARAWCYARCLIVEDLAYAVEHRPDLVAFELANLDRLFAVGDYARRDRRYSPRPLAWGSKDVELATPSPR